MSTNPVAPKRVIALEPYSAAAVEKPDPICLYTRAWRASGTGLFAQELVDGLLTSGAEVTFVSPVVDNAKMEQPRERLRRLRPVREIVGPAPRLVRAFRSLRRIFGSFVALFHARLYARTFIITIPDPLLLFLPILLLLRLTGARVIFIAHDPIPHGWRFPARWRGVEKASHGACYYLSNAVVVLSEASRQKLLESFPRLRVVVDVIEHGDFAFPQAAPIPGNGQLLAFGTVRRNKGVREAIEGCIAARRAGANVHLVVAGEVYREEPDYADECLALALTAPDAVTMQIGYVDDAALPNLIARSDALLMPYRDFFSQSGVALLAASNARPIIASEAGGITSLIQEGMPSTVIAPPVDSDSVANAILRHIATPAERWTELAMAYRLFTLERRSWPSLARRYAALANRIKH